MTRHLVSQVLRSQSLPEVQRKLQDRIADNIFDMAEFVEIFEKILLDARHSYDGAYLRVLVIDAFYLFSRSNVRHFPPHISYVNDRPALEISSAYDLIIVIDARLHRPQKCESSIIIHMDLVTRTKFLLTILGKRKT